MYSRGGNAYGQQSYSGQSAYNQSLGSNYAGNFAGGPDLAARHLAMLGSSQNAEIDGYISHSSAGASKYGGQYNSVYGSAGLSSSQQAIPMSIKGPGPASLEGRTSYASARQESPPKYKPADYSSSARGHGHKVDPLYSEKIPDYSSIDRRQYGEQQSAYLGRELRSEPSGRYADSIGYGHQRQVEPRDSIDQASLLRREQLLKVQSMQSSSIENGSRQVDYLASRGAAVRHSTQDLMSYSRRSDPDSRNLQLIGGSSFDSQQTPSILGAAPRRVADDIMFAQGSPNPGYGVSLPPGRDYGSAKGLLSASLELDYPGSVMSRGSHSRFDEHKDDQSKYVRQLESREEDRRRERLRVRDREREREREKERERERERERLRTLERRVAVEVNRDRTTIRLSRDRRGPSLTTDARLSRKESPRRELSHRRHSPIKEKRREYVCKVHSYQVVDLERDYLSLDKRYPKFLVPPEFSKLVVYWPQEDLKLSLHTAVSFEHDFSDEEENANLLKTPPIDQIATGYKEAKPRDTVWNAKVILMSGLSRSALEDLVSESDDRIVHICNILRFCILKLNHAFTAIGGPWDVIDGANPSVDDSSLVQTALRHVKETAQLDLQKCQHWNRFLEIHYDRIGQDGLFSHKEITVLYLPDLSECLPSFDAWKNQWLEQQIAVAEKERQSDLKKEKSKSKEEPRVKKASSNSAKKEGKKSDINKTESKGVNVNKEEKPTVEVEKKDDDNESKEDKPEGSKSEQVNSDAKCVKVEKSAVTESGTKTVKKKIIKKVVKKVVDKGSSAVENAEASKNKEKMDEKDRQVDNAKPVIGSPNTEASANPTSTKTKTVPRKKFPVSKENSNKTNDSSSEVKAERETVANSEKFPTETVEIAAEGGKEPVAKPIGIKTTTIKRKVIKKVPKKKTAGVEALDGDNNNNSDVKDEMVVAEGSLKQSLNTEIQATEAVNLEKKESPVTKSTSDAGKISTTSSVSKTDAANVKVEKSENGSKSVKEDKDNVGKDDARSHSKELIDKKKHAEPPRPGFILKTKSAKDTKVRTVSLSLESLLDYTDNDFDESTFEISVFAESMYEMLQYQMASRILNFLQKLRIKFVSKRNQKKREREKSSVKDKAAAPSKRLKADDSKVKDSPEKTVIVEKEDTDNKCSVEGDGVDKISPADGLKDEVPSAAVAMEEVPSADIAEEEVPLPDVAEDVLSTDDCIHIMEEEEDRLDLETAESDEDPEEEVDQMKDDVSPKLADEEIDKMNTEIADLPMEEVEKKGGNVEKFAKDTRDRTRTENAEAGKDKKLKTENNKEKKKETPAAKEVVDRELLQAFRFFDRNRVGYIRVEDMRLIIHTLGQYLSHRDVKELVQSALLETNTGRDDRILYNKLVRMSNI